MRPSFNRGFQQCHGKPKAQGFRPNKFPMSLRPHLTPQQVVVNCCHPCNHCQKCTCECRKCLDCRPCKCSYEQPEEQPSVGPSCICGPCPEKRCQGCVCLCGACKRDCDLCICQNSSQDVSESISYSVHRISESPRTPSPPPTPSFHQHHPESLSPTPCDDDFFGCPDKKECSCSSCDHCLGCKCGCIVCKKKCHKCSCGRVLKDPRMSAVSRIVDNGFKYKFVYILINLCTRCPVGCLQLYLDLAAAFTDCQGKLACLDPENIAISAAPLETNPSYDGKIDTELLAEGQRLIPGNIKIAVTLSAIPVNWTVNPIPITLTGRLNCENVLISTVVEGDECC